MTAQGIYKPTRQSSAIGLGLMGFGIILTTTILYRWKIQPYLKNKRNRENEEWAEYVFTQEQKNKLEAVRSERN